jgi:hypothetical protein
MSHVINMKVSHIPAEGKAWITPIHDFFRNIFIQPYVMGNETRSDGGCIYRIQKN